MSGNIHHSYPRTPAESPRSKTLSVTADLKATQIAQDLGLYRDLAQAVSTRNGVQGLLKEYNEGNTSATLDLDLEVVPTLTWKHSTDDDTDQAPTGSFRWY